MTHVSRKLALWMAHTPHAPHNVPLTFTMCFQANMHVSLLSKSYKVSPSVYVREAYHGLLLTLPIESSPRTTFHMYV